VHLNAYSTTATSSCAPFRAQGHRPRLLDNLVAAWCRTAKRSSSSSARRGGSRHRADRIEVHRGRAFELVRRCPKAASTRQFTSTTRRSRPTWNRRTRTAKSTPSRRAGGGLFDAIERDEFTLESALAMIESLTRRCGIATTHGLYLYT